MEYYFRNVSGSQGAAVDDLYDHGFWRQSGRFVIPDKFQLLARWSRVVGNEGTLRANNQTSEEVAGGLEWYFQDQYARITIDATYLDGAPISSSALNVSPSDIGWLVRSQIQFSF